MQKSSFFNSINGDRKYKTEAWAEQIASFVGNGVLANPADNLRVQVSTGMTVVVRGGRAWINGYFYWNTDDYLITLSTADGVLKRIDRIVIRWSLSERNIALAVKKGTPSANPTSPVIQRDADIYELVIADVAINNGTVAILSANIADTRYLKELCGKVVPLFEELDLSDFYEECGRNMAEQIKEWETQTKEQDIKWEAQTKEQDIKWKNHMAGSKAQRDEIQAWYDDIRTAVFAKMQLNFDNWIYMPGKTYKTRFNPDGSIRERIANTLTDVTFCERITSFTGSGVTENIQCNEFNLNMVKTSTFLSDGGIDEIITGDVGLLEPSGSGNIALHNLLTNLSFEKSGHVGFASSEEVVQMRQELFGVKENLQSALTVLNGGV